MGTSLEGGEPGRLLGRVLRGGFWGFASNAVLHLMALARHLLMMRLLAPEIHGRWTLVYLSLVALKTVFDPGIDKAVPARDDAEQSDVLRTAWTVSLMRGLLLGGMMLAAAGPIAGFFKVPAVAGLIRVTAVVLVLEGCFSAGTLRLVRRLDFRRLFWIQQGANVLGFATAVVAAVLIKSAAAFVAAEIVRAGVYLVLSFALAPLAPLPLLSRRVLRGLWHYSRALYAHNVLQFLLLWGPLAVVGRLLASGELGVFKSAFMFASIPSLALSEVLSRVMLPAFAHIREDPRRTAGALAVTLRLSSMTVMPLVVLLSLVSPAIAAFGGVRWSALPTPLTIMCIGGAFYCLRAAVTPLLLGASRPGLLSLVSGTRRLVLAALVVPMTMQWQLAGAALACMIANVPAFVLAMFVGARMTALPQGTLQRACWVGLFPAAASAVVMLLSRLLFDADTALYTAVAIPGACLAALLVALSLERASLRLALDALRGAEGKK